MSTATDVVEEATVVEEEVVEAEVEAEVEEEVIVEAEEVEEEEVVADVPTRDFYGSYSAPDYASIGTTGRPQFFNAYTNW